MVSKWIEAITKYSAELSGDLLELLPPTSGYQPSDTEAVEFPGLESPVALAYAQICLTIYYITERKIPDYENRWRKCLMILRAYLATKHVDIIIWIVLHIGGFTKGPNLKWTEKDWLRHLDAALQLDSWPIPQEEILQVLRAVSSTYESRSLDA